MDPDQEMAAAMGFSSFGTQPQSHSRKRQKLSASKSNADDRHDGSAVNIIVPTTATVTGQRERKEGEEDAVSFHKEETSEQPPLADDGSDGGNNGAADAAPGRASVMGTQDGTLNKDFTAGGGTGGPHDGDLETGQQDPGQSASNSLAAQDTNNPSTAPPSLPAATDTHPPGPSHTQQSSINTNQPHRTHQDSRGTNNLPSRPQQSRHHHHNNQRNGVWQGDEGGYYDESFVEDPWRGLRA